MTDIVDVVEDIERIASRARADVNCELQASEGADEWRISGHTLLGFRDSWDKLLSYVRSYL